ncbi:MULTISPECIES: alpha/beta fold hydrolase [Arthrobacter]|uniref:Alpha/beta fold hydrolase n=1 Tax=Arthrobacter terricola TaxID=2547396 RepID=A0A4R5KTR7_9MICC|nr:MULTISPECIES: alpha/beta fold hydrolase [Arthrobacter]MBT8160479.1 alpha/beta hydrolase [Arthrobacter sp. GN70]TDF98478.1 alpha/beta fold hydrolase [Arthrobacter terricola]
MLEEPSGIAELHVDRRRPAPSASTTAALTRQPPVLLVHGWASTVAYWEPLAAELLDEGFEVWIPELPGYHPGEALPEGFAWTLESAAASIAAIAAEYPSPVHVAGHSLGGSVALTLSANYPGLVASVALIGMVPAPPNQGFKSMLEAQLEQGFIDDATRAKCMKAWFGPLAPDEERLLGEGFNLPFDVLGPSGLAAMAGVAADVPNKVTAPTLVIAGVGDRVRSLDQAESFVAASPGRQLVAIPDAGHSVHWEQPHACAEALGAFWRETSPPPA